MPDTFFYFMMINESFNIVNYSIPSNLSQNLTTLMLITRNLNCPQIPEPSLFTQIFPIVTLIIGAILTFTVDMLLNKLKEIKEIRRYEYVIIDDILDIVKGENPIDSMVDYYQSQKKDHRFVKIKSYKEVQDFIQKTIRGETADPTYLLEIHKKLYRKI